MEVMLNSAFESAYARASMNSRIAGFREAWIPAPIRPSVIFGWLPWRWLRWLTLQPYRKYR